MKIDKYIGNGAYCYSNSTSMLLASIGEDASPSLIEVVGGVGLGAYYLPGTNIAFFSNFSGLPDQAISKTLEILGFEFTENAQKNSDDYPLENLKKLLKKGPVVLGPLDMGHLVYNPEASDLGGVDHFVLAYDADENYVYLHDPAGFPHVYIDFENLKKTWKAERIGYKRGHYRCWTQPKRVKNPTEDEIYNLALEHFKFIYRNGEKYGKKKGRIIDIEAIIKLAENTVSGKLEPSDIGMLNSFVFQLGAKRALDYASFFASRNQELSELKNQQAVLFGRCHTLVVLKKWQELSETLKSFAEVEKEFKTLLLKS